jgi:hypothetical protein
MRTIHFLPYSILIMTILFSGCKKQEPDMSSIEILSARQLSLTTFKVVIRSEVHSGLRAELVFEDLTEPGNDPVFELNFTKDYLQTDTFRYNINRLNHNYLVKASLMRDGDPVAVSEMLISPGPVSYEINVFQDLLYTDPENNIARKLSNNQTFGLEIHYRNAYPVKSIEVKLNKSISLVHTFDLNYVNHDIYWSGEYGDISGGAYLNEQIGPGIYDVYLYIDSIEFKADARIEVLKDHWTLINSDFPGPESYQFATFTDGDNLYLTGGVDFVQKHPTVWKYNFTLDEWKQLNDFPAQEIQIRNANLENEGTWYIAAEDYLKSDSTVLWKYDPGNDSWQQVTTYPGHGMNLTCFMVHGRFFAGGGIIITNNEITYCYDFWSFDLTSKSWTQCRDLPLSHPYPTAVSCTSGNTAYTYSSENTFWSYDPSGDQWSLQGTFPGLERGISNLVSLDNKIYLIGAQALNGGWLQDCWEYDISVNTWQLNSFIPNFNTPRFAVPFKNSLLTGAGFPGMDQPFLYRMTP